MLILTNSTDPDEMQRDESSLFCQSTRLGVSSIQRIHPNSHMFYYVSLINVLIWTVKEDNVSIGETDNMLA